jgi:DNA-binding response OmpR family regulator
LFIENGIDNIQLLVDNLRAAGYIVDNFIDHLKASSVYEKDPDKYNVVIVDLQSTSNHELREIKNMNKNVKILAIAASEINFNGTGIDGILKKPFDVEMFVHMVRKLAKPTITLANTYCL